MAISVIMFLKDHNNILNDSLDKSTAIVAKVKSCNSNFILASRFLSRRDEVQPNKTKQSS